MDTEAATDARGADEAPGEYRGLIGGDSVGIGPTDGPITPHACLWQGRRAPTAASAGTGDS